jgi:hypothetical protein
MHSYDLLFVRGFFGGCVAIVAEAGRNNKILMKKRSRRSRRSGRSLSSLPSKDRFLVYVVMTTLVVASVIAAMFIGLKIQQRIHFSDNNSNPASPAATSYDGNDASTNSPAPPTDSIISGTNSN